MASRCVGNLARIVARLGKHADFHGVISIIENPVYNDCQIVNQQFKSSLTHHLDQEISRASNAELVDIVKQCIQRARQDTIQQLKQGTADDKKNAEYLEKLVTCADQIAELSVPEVLPKGNVCKFIEKGARCLKSLEEGVTCLQVVKNILSWLL